MVPNAEGLSAARSSTEQSPKPMLKALQAADVAMPRYFFHINNGKPHRDETGEDLRDARQAWLAAQRLTRDIEDTLEPNAHWQVEVTDPEGRALYRIEIAARKIG